MPHIVFHHLIRSKDSQADHISKRWEFVMSVWVALLIVVIYIVVLRLEDGSPIPPSNAQARIIH